MHLRISAERRKPKNCHQMVKMSHFANVRFAKNGPLSGHQDRGHLDLNLPLGFREPLARRKELPKKKRRTGYCSAFLLLPIDSRCLTWCRCCSRIDVLAVIPRSDDTMFRLLGLTSSSLFLLDLGAPRFQVTSATTRKGL